ncbi:MAG: hypothetical protein WD426_15740 [Anditalea sp.]
METEKPQDYLRNGFCLRKLDKKQPLYSGKSSTTVSMYLLALRTIFNLAIEAKAIY